MQDKKNLTNYCGDCVQQFTGSTPQASALELKKHTVKYGGKCKRKIN